MKRKRRFVAFYPGRYEDCHYERGDYRTNYPRYRRPAWDRAGTWSKPMSWRVRRALDRFDARMEKTFTLWSEATE